MTLGLRQQQVKLQRMNCGLRYIEAFALVNEITKYANSLPCLRDLALVCVLLDTGVQIGEALNMTFSNVHLATGFIRVVGKGNKKQFVPIGDSVRVLLQRCLMRRMAIRNVGNRFFIATIGTSWKCFFLPLTIDY